jgi:hypothetical protein
MNGAHLVEKNGFFKKIRTVCFQGMSVLNMQKHFLFVSNFEHVNYAINEKLFQRFFMSIQIILCFPCYIPNIQKCSFKGCPFSWMAAMIVFLTFDTNYIICRIVEIKIK